MAPSVSAVDIWYLQFGESAFGPMTLEEVRAVQKSGAFEGHLLVSRSAPGAWMPIEKLEELAPPALETPQSGSEADRRRKKRKRLLAVVRFDTVMQSSAERNRYAGMGHDISIGGMLILSSNEIGGQSTRLFLTVTPLQGAMIGPFNCEAEISHVLTHDKGFGVRFIQLSDKVRREIQHFENTPGT